MAVTDFYKHPFRRVSELKKPALDDMEHRHSSGRTDGEKEAHGVNPHVKTRVGDITCISKTPNVAPMCHSCVFVTVCIQ